MRNGLDLHAALGGDAVDPIAPAVDRRGRHGELGRKAIDAVHGSNGFNDSDVFVVHAKTR